MKSKDEIKLARVITDNKIKCKCGHTVFIPKYLEKELCTWCNRWVYRSKEIEFKNKLQDKLRRKKINGK